jgi:hypothetical protein
MSICLVKIKAELECITAKICKFNLSPEQKLGAGFVI